MATVTVAREAGACFGVERALKMVRERAAQATGAVHTLGPLIHNPQVVAELDAAGVTVVDTPEVAADATLFLRTHGVTRDVEQAARATGAEVIDATCPFVKRVHRAVERLARDGYQVLVVGEAGHPEVEGTASRADGVLVIGDAREAASVTLAKKVGVVVQTTMARSVLREVVGELIGRVEELCLIDTICEATSERQQAAAQLAAEVDVMVVIGGRNSANTTHLADICRDACPRTHHIETADELDAGLFEGVERIGITAGASTPQDQIDAVRTAIEGLVGA